MKNASSVVASLLLACLVPGATAQPVRTPSPIPDVPVLSHPASKNETVNTLITRAEATAIVDNGKAGPGRHKFNVFFSGHPANPNATSVGKVVDGDGKDLDDWTDPAWEIQVTTTQLSGYALARGWYPIIRTNIVRAVSAGTTLLVQVLPPASGTDPLKGTHRVLLMEGGPVTIHNLIDATNAPVELKNAFQYVEATFDEDSGKPILSAAKTLPDTPNATPEGEFRKYVNLVLSRPGAIQLLYTDLE